MKFKESVHFGNVVLLELKISLDFNENIAAACLTDEPIDYENEKCYTNSWFENEGKTAAVKTLFSYH